MPYLGSTPADKALEADDIASSAVTTAKIANDAVDTDKINLVSTSSTPSLEAKGTSGQTEGYIQLNCAENSHGIKLKSPPHSAGQSYTLTYPQSIVDGGFMKTDSSGNLSFAGAGYEFVSSGSASGGSSIDFTNMADGYDYIYVFQHISSASDGVSWTAEVGVSGPTYRTSGYKSSLVGINNAGSSTSIESTSNFLMASSANEGMGTGTGEAIKGGEFVLFNPANSSTETAGQSQLVLYGASPQLVPKFMAGYYETAEANVAVRFKTSSGNCTGTILQFRRVRS